MSETENERHLHERVNAQEHTIRELSETVVHQAVHLRHHQEARAMLDAMGTELRGKTGEVSRLTAEVRGLKHDLAETEAERDRYRALGVALGEEAAEAAADAVDEASKAINADNERLRQGLAETERDKDVLIGSLQRQVREKDARIGALVEALNRLQVEWNTRLERISALSNASVRQRILRECGIDEGEGAG